MGFSSNEVNLSFLFGSNNPTDKQETGTEQPYDLHKVIQDKQEQEQDAGLWRCSQHIDRTTRQELALKGSACWFTYRQGGEWLLTK